MGTGVKDSGLIHHRSRPGARASLSSTLSTSKSESELSMVSLLSGSHSSPLESASVIPKPFPPSESTFVLELSMYSGRPTLTFGKVSLAVESCVPSTPSVSLGAS